MVNDQFQPCVKNTKGEIWTLVQLSQYRELRIDAVTIVKAFVTDWPNTVDPATGRELDDVTWIYRHPLIGGEEIDQWRGLVQANYNRPLHPFRAGIREDETLWMWESTSEADQNTMGHDNSLPDRVGNESNWRAIADLGSILLLKGDGTIWKLDDSATNKRGRLQKFDSHSDWVALTNTWSGTLSLSAHGGLWSWGERAWTYEVFIGFHGIECFREIEEKSQVRRPFSVHLTGIKLIAPRGPVYLGNIFDTSSSSPTTPPGVVPVEFPPQVR